MVLKVEPINYELKSEYEKERIITIFSQIFNLVDFDFQVLVHSEIMNLKDVISDLEKKKEFSQDQITKNKNLLIDEYIDLLKRYSLTKNSNKSYYIVLKQSLNTDMLLQNGQDFNKDKTNKLEMENANDLFGKLNEKTIETHKNDKFTNSNLHQDIDNLYIQSTYQRVKIIQKKLLQCGNSSKILTSKEILDIIAKMMNREIQC